MSNMNWEQREEKRDVDKSCWPDGPWDAEPDRVEWRHLGFPCLIVRNDMSGALCGYVGVPPGHPALNASDEAFEVHGGVTYGAPCDETGKICHVAQPGEPDEVHWIGFDCAHAGDLCPGMKELRFNDWTYRDVNYVRAEVERLAEQVFKFGAS